MWESKTSTALSTESTTVPKKIVSKILPAQLSGGEQGLEIRVIKVNPLTSLTLRQCQIIPKDNYNILEKNDNDSGCECDVVPYSLRHSS